jgi:hypothetical protein
LSAEHEWQTDRPNLEKVHASHSSPLSPRPPLPPTTLTLHRPIPSEPCHCRHAVCYPLILFSFVLSSLDNRIVVCHLANNPCSQQFLQDGGQRELCVAAGKRANAHCQHWRIEQCRERRVEWSQWLVNCPINLPHARDLRSMCECQDLRLKKSNEVLIHRDS